MTPQFIRGASLSTEDRDPPPGMLDYEARNAIRNLIKQDGLEAAREKIGHFIEDEKGRRQ
jgi:hypothetical protein